MKISGFTIVRNGSSFDYPYIESIRSLLPIVDELIVNVGTGTDDTLKHIIKLTQDTGGEKINFFESHWPLDDPEKKKGGLILSEQTNLALQKCTGDWCIYLQADEVLHEGDTDSFLSALNQADKNPNVEGLLFNYIHLYGSFDIIQETRSAYRKEVRAIRKSVGPISVGDAQSFRKQNGEKLNVINSGARVFHYGWVRTPEAMREKTYFMDELYHGPTKNETTPHSGENYKYKRFWGLKPYKGSHPKVMDDRILNKGWSWDFKNSPLVWNIFDTKKIILDTIEKITGHRLFEYRSYKIIRENKK